MRTLKYFILSATMLVPAAAHGNETVESAPRDIVVSGELEDSSSATKTDTPAIEVPQPVTIVRDEVFEAQGAVSISDTLNYVAGVTANPYGPDSRVDGALVRGVNAAQFRDGMRDIFSYYASIRADPYNFQRIELVRGPASVLFGQGSLGGIINMVSKRPQFESAGEVSLRYGSFDRKELLADITGPLADKLAVRMVARVRNSDTQTNYVSDDRLMLAPSVTYAPSESTELTFIGLYQEDDGGSTAQFLPLVGTLLDNPNGQLSNSLFIGKPGWDRYDGRLLQGTAILAQQFSDDVRLNLKARYIDSDLTYFTHYPNSYSNPANPYVELDPSTGEPVLDPLTGMPLPDPDQRTIGLYADGSYATLDIFSTDNNVQFDFSTGSTIEHTLLAGIDYSWNRVQKTAGFTTEYIDIYDIDYDALSDFGGGLPQPEYASADTRQEQLGFYLQDQVRIWDRVSLVLGARRDMVTSTSFGIEEYDSSATTFRAGIIGELIDGISPFFSYTESFEPVSGMIADGSPLRPKTGQQLEAGIKFHPLQNVMMTITGYHIQENGRAIDDPNSPNPDFQIQVDGVTSKGAEFEANAVLPGRLQIIANLSYNEAEIDGTNQQLDNVPRFNASIWAMKGFELGNDMDLNLGGGVRHVGKNKSYGWAFPDGITTPAFTLVDTFAEVNWQRWSVSVNATNLFDKRYYAACLARGDCFMGSERNVFGTVSYRF